MLHPANREGAPELGPHLTPDRRRRCSPAPPPWPGWRCSIWSTTCELFGHLPPGTVAMPGGWAIFARLVAGSFLFLAGVSLVLAHGRRHPLAVFPAPPRGPDRRGPRRQRPRTYARRCPTQLRLLRHPPRHRRQQRDRPAGPARCRRLSPSPSPPPSSPCPGSGPAPPSASPWLALARPLPHPSACRWISSRSSPGSPPSSLGMAADRGRRPRRPLARPSAAPMARWLRRLGLARAPQPARLPAAPAGPAGRGLALDTNLHG